MGPSCYIEYRGIRNRAIRGFYCINNAIQIAKFVPGMFYIEPYVGRTWSNLNTLKTPQSSAISYGVSIVSIFKTTTMQWCQFTVPGVGVCAWWMGVWAWAGVPATEEWSRSDLADTGKKIHKHIVICETVTKWLLLHRCYFQMYTIFSLQRRFP